MNDKQLLELINEYLLFNGIEEKEQIEKYIKENNVCVEDYKKLVLVFINIKMFDYVDCNKYEDVINNIDNDDFMNNEDNYY